MSQKKTGTCDNCHAEKQVMRHTKGYLWWEKEYWYCFWCGLLKIMKGEI